MAAILLNNKHDLAKYESQIFQMLDEKKIVHFIMHDHNCDQHVTFEKLLKGEYPNFQIFLMVNPSLQLEVFHLVNIFNQNNPVHFGDGEEDTTPTPAGMTKCPACNKETRV